MVEKIIALSTLGGVDKNSVAIALNVTLGNQADLGPFVEQDLLLWLSFFLDFFCQLKLTSYIVGHAQKDEVWKVH